MKQLLLTPLFLLVLFSSQAQSCLGRWVTIDDETNKKKSVVELYKDEDGKMYGKIVYLFPREGREENPKCKKCTDDRKDQLLIGLQIVRGMNWDGSEWEDGTIVDPENGKIYSVKIWLDSENSDRLNVRGYSGPFYRTQRWVRLPK